MTFKYLPDSLVQTAKVAADFFRDNHGIKAFNAEEQVYPELSYRPTLHATTSDFHHLLIEVNESPYPTFLETVVMDCHMKGLPVKLWVAYPVERLSAEYKARVDRARSHGVGILEISGKSVQVIYSPLPLSLAGVRCRPKTDFPPRYREALTTAETTFKFGSPSQGYFLVQSEIEQLSRKLASKVTALGLWRTLKQGEKLPTLSSVTSWSKVMETLMDFIDYRKCKSIDRALLNRVAGLTAHRNEAGHKPGSSKALIQRDQQARTRFKNAEDVLFDLISAVKPFRIT